MNTQSILIQGANVLLPTGTVETCVLIENGLIAGIGDNFRADITIMGKGFLLTPSLIDVHGDSFERQIMPRPGVKIPLEIAIKETDKQLATNGITTGYHAITFSWEDGLRSIDSSQKLISFIDRFSNYLSVENRIQIRWETFAFEAIEFIEKSFLNTLPPALAFNDHTSITMRPFNTTLQQRPFEHSLDFEAANLKDPRLTDRIGSKVKRSGMSEKDYLEKLGKIWERKPEVPNKIKELAKIANLRNIPLLSHDDTQIETRDFFRKLGSKTTEFPMTAEVTQHAKNENDITVFGAPNVLRGGSHTGSVSASDMVEDGLCDVLASDYYYPALLGAIHKLHRERRGPLERLWSLISGGPAAAMRINDRGIIEIGKRGDLLLLNWLEEGPPLVAATISNGKIVHSNGIRLVRSKKG
ncbi:MAG: alpha-D-ribose 1-methylphosphonate 5-triphosphate diphosphatase [Paracoccaceae bacterium]|jgi:alpha-D-ribose 1-methylphosphonate 5-triphosphate diphosphatase